MGGASEPRSGINDVGPIDESRWGRFRSRGDHSGGAHQRRMSGGGGRGGGDDGGVGNFRLLLTGLGGQTRRGRRWRNRGREKRWSRGDEGRKRGLFVVVVVIVVIVFHAKRRENGSMKGTGLEGFRWFRLGKRMST